jgi:hypothetical protein
MKTDERLGTAYCTANGLESSLDMDCCYNTM